jgi:hypothetical protein
VEWHRDQVTITITFADDTTERYDTNNLFEAWEKITQKIPNATKLLLAQPNPTSQQLLDSASPNKSLVLTTRDPIPKWYLILNKNCYPATRNRKGKVFITPDAAPVTVPSYLYTANAWGKGFIQSAMSGSFPIPQEHTLDNDTVKIDQLTIKRLTQLIYKKTNRKPPNAIKNGIQN